MGLISLRYWAVVQPIQHEGDRFRYKNESVEHGESNPSILALAQFWGTRGLDEVGAGWGVQAIAARQRLLH